MAETTDRSSDSIATRVILVLLIVVSLFTLFSIAVLVLISHNVYASSYYSLSTLFDANSEGASAFITSALAAGPSYIFYGFIAISLVDGLAKAAIIGFLIAGFINLLSSIDLKSKFETITVKHLKNHVIVAGYSMLAERLASDLKRNRINFVVIEKSQEKVNLLKDMGLNVIEGDFTDKKVLNDASIGKAKTIVFTTESDFVNLLGIVTAHHIMPELKIISRARSESSIRKMQRGGAALCLVPEVVAGIELGERIAKL
jgi:hypothetical protein